MIFHFLYKFIFRNLDGFIFGSPRVVNFAWIFIVFSLQVSQDSLTKYFYNFSGFIGKLRKIVFVFSRLLGKCRITFQIQKLTSRIFNVTPNSYQLSTSLKISFWVEKFWLNDTLCNFVCTHFLNNFSYVRNFTKKCFCL